MASIFVLLEAFNRKEATWIFFLVQQPHFLCIYERMSL